MSQGHKYQDHLIATLIETLHYFSPRKHELAYELHSWDILFKIIPQSQDKKGGDVFFFKSTILQFEGSKNDLFGKKQMKCIIYLQDSSKIYAFMTYNI